MRERTTKVTNPIEQELLSVIREYERVIYKVCYLYINPNTPLNDPYQDATLNLWEAHPKFRRECETPVWTYRIVLNTCISLFRKEKNAPEIVTLTREADWIIEEHDPIRKMLRQFYQMINQLGQLDKSIILLYLEDKSYEGVAEITGLTVTNVAIKLSRIKDKLRKMKKEQSYMELEELKKSWNALDEHLKDKELIKEEEPGKLIGHADKGIYVIARLNIKLILISLPALILFLLEAPLHGRLNSIYIIIILSWTPTLCWGITITCFPQQTKADEMPLIEMISRVDCIHRRMIRECLIATAFLLTLTVLSFTYWQIWQYGIVIILFFALPWGAGLGLIPWIYRKKFLNRIQETKKNLGELKIIDS